MELTMDMLKAAFHKAIIEEIKYIGIKVEMEGFPKDEIIINERENFYAKLQYYIKAYDEDLVLKSFGGIRIVGISVRNSFENIEKDFI